MPSLGSFEEYSKVLFIFMRNFLLISFAALVATGCMSFFILFEGNPKLVQKWWAEFARESETLPFAPYKSRVVSTSEIRTESANELIILDHNLFWRGSGAIIIPQLNNDKTVKKFVVKHGGRGFSGLVKAYVSGAGGASGVGGASGRVKLEWKDRRTKVCCVVWYLLLVYAYHVRETNTNRPSTYISYSITFFTTAVLTTNNNISYRR